MPDIDRINAAGAALQQHLRKSAGRGADVKADAVFWGDMKVVKRGCELYTAARHIRMHGTRMQFRIGRNFLGGLGHHSPIDRHETGFDRGLRLGAALEQAALDQKPIDALARRGHGRAPCTEAGCSARNKVSHMVVSNVGPIALSMAATIV